MIQQAELLRETEHASSLNGLRPGAADGLNAFPSRTLVLQITANEDQICSCQTFDGQSYQARAFIQANTPTTHERQGLFRSDRDRPGGLTLVP